MDLVRQLDRQTKLHVGCDYACRLNSLYITAYTAPTIVTKYYSGKYLLVVLLSRVSTLTRDTDTAILSVCPSVYPSVTFGYSTETA